MRIVTSFAAASMISTALSLTAAGAARPQVDQAFYAFWPRFRAAVLADDAKTLRALSAPTLRLPGLTDDAEVKIVPRDQVASLVRTALAQDSGIDLKRVVTGRQFIESTPEMTQPFAPLIAIGGDGAQVGPFEFRRVAQGWRLTGVAIRTDLD